MNDESMKKYLYNVQKILIKNTEDDNQIDDKKPLIMIKSSSKALKYLLSEKIFYSISKKLSDVFLEQKDKCTQFQQSKVIELGFLRYLFKV